MISQNTLAGTATVETAEEFEACFIRHYARIQGMLFRLTGSSAEAEDLAIETFWRLWVRHPAGLEHAGAWLTRVAVRLGYNYLRSRKRRDRYEERAGTEHWMGRADQDPQSAAERGALRDRVHETLRQMRSRNAKLLVLHHSGYSYREIASALGLNPNSVGVLLGRAEREFERIFRKGD